MSTEERTISEVEILLNRCRAAKTLEEQKRCFDDLAVFLETIETRNNHNNEIIDDTTKSVIRNNDAVKALAARENIARSVLTTWPYGHVSACVDRVLDACGPMVSISTCSGLLKEIANSDRNNRNGSQESSLSFASSSSWTPSSSSLPLRSIVQACWATIQRTLLTTTPPSSLSSSSKTKRENNSDDERKRLELQRFVSTVVLLLPQTLANACHTVKLQVPLHGTPTHFFPRLIYFAWMQMQFQVRKTLVTPTNDWNFNNYQDDDGSLLFSVLYAKILITQLLQKRRSEHVAQGLMQRFGGNSSKGSLLLDGKNSDAGEDDSIENDHETAMLSSFLISLELVARDMATLILALLQYVNTRGYAVDKDKVFSSTTSFLSRCHNTECRARAVCNSLFHSSSIEHQETIVEQLSFSNKASYSGFRNSGSVRDDSQQSVKKDQRRWSRWVVETIAPSAVSLDGIDDVCISLFSKRLANIADRWSQLTFVQEVDGRQQHHVSLVLWHGLVFLERLSVSLQDPGQRELVSALVSGVSHRLGSILPTLRQDGMRIAQQLAKGLGQDDVLFDEFIVDDESDSGEDRQDISSDDSDDKIDNEKKETIETKDKYPSKQEINGFFDPDADYDSDIEKEVDTKDRRPHTSTNEGLDTGNEDDSENDDDLSVEWKDELIPYDLEDDEEDLRETPRPLHLLEALDLLRTGENHDHAFTRHEAALEALPSLIRKRPDDLADVAVSLALELLRMEDKFNIDDFNTKRESAIRTLLVEEPLSVGQALIEQLFEESGLADKLSILASLQSAAFELSGNKLIAETFMKKSTSSKNTSLSVGQNGDDKSMMSPANQVSRVLSKSRRKRSRSQQKAINNHFSNTAQMWFYLLIMGFIKHRDDENLWAGSTGSIFLAYFFRCLATIVEFSGIQASQVLANDLLDLVWDFRTADVPEVRLSALVAVSTSIAMLSNEKLISLLFGEANLPITLHEMSRIDPDKECRSLCQTISLSIHEVLNSSF